MALKGLFVGLTTVDIQYFTDTFPKTNVKVKTETPDIYVGGPATNAAVAYSFLGGESHLYSFVGNNSFKEFILSDFKTNKIIHNDIGEELSKLPVLASVITSKESGDRNIFTYNPADIKEQINSAEIINSIKPDFIFIDGFYPSISLQILTAAKEFNLPIIFDGGSWKEHLPALLPFVDVAICSNNFIPPNCKSKNEIVEFLSKYNIDTTVITRGDESILVYDFNDQYEIAVKETQVIDTLGAGDFFHGAFCYFQKQFNDIETAIKKSSSLATESCKFKGTREWLIKLKPEAFY